MIEKIKKISNPLTIIAIFAGLAEIAGTTALFGIGTEIQNIFIWFVMLFPTLIVVLFFITLNFNPSVLYAPSDFENDDTFLEALKGKKVVDANFKSLEEEVNRLSSTIETSIAPKLQELKDTNKEEIKATLRDELAAIRARVSITKEATDSLSLSSLPNSALQAKIIEFISGSDAPVAGSEVARAVNMNILTVYKALIRLAERGAIIKSEEGYVLNTL